VAHLSLPGHDGLGGEFLLDRLTLGRSWILGKHRKTIGKWWKNVGKPWEDDGKL